MKNSKTGNNKFLKEFNETSLLDLIRLNKQISKADLAQLTGLSPTASGIIVSKLIEKEYIYEAGVGTSKGGRRPVLYELNAKSYFSIGVDIDVDYIRFILMDITGQLEYREQVINQCINSVEDTAKLVDTKIKQIVSTYKINSDRLVGVGISIPGLIDSETSEIILAPNLGWEKIQFEDTLAKYNNYSVYVENEAMCSAICENWIGSCTEEKNFVCINMKSGIGSSIFTDGNLYRGCCGSAGEIGHIMVDQNGPKCACGNYGCLETLLSAKQIVEKAQRLTRQGILTDITGVQDIDNITLEDVIQTARDGNETARQILLEAAGYLGLAMSNLINTINPSKIVIGKELAKFADLVMEHVRSIVNTNALRYPASRVEILSSKMGDDISALGAAIIPLKQLFGYRI